MDFWVRNKLMTKFFQKIEGTPFKRFRFLQICSKYFNNLSRYIAYHGPYILVEPSHSPEQIRLRRILIYHHCQILPVLHLQCEWVPMERLYQKVSQKYFTKLLHSTIKGEAIQLEILTKNDVTKCCFCQFVVISGTVKQVWKLK